MSHRLKSPLHAFRSSGGSRAGARRHESVVLPAETLIRNQFPAGGATHFLASTDDGTTWLACYTRENIQLQ